MAHICCGRIYNAGKNVKLVANMGTDGNSKVAPSFLLGGVIYSINKNTDVDIVGKYGLNRPAGKYSILAGMTVRF